MHLLQKMKKLHIVQMSGIFLKACVFLRRWGCIFKRKVHLKVHLLHKHEEIVHSLKAQYFLERRCSFLNMRLYVQKENSLKVQGRKKIEETVQYIVEMPMFFFERKCIYFIIVKSCHHFIIMPILKAKEITKSKPSQLRPPWLPAFKTKLSLYFLHFLCPLYVLK